MRSDIAARSSGQDQRWTTKEDAVLREHYPSYDRLTKRLPHRTISALKHRVRVIGIVARRHIWTNVEVARLHKACEAGATDRELEALFPGLGLIQIKSKARHIGAARRKARPVPFGVPALDAIRTRAADARLSFVELDRRAGTGRFFQKSCRYPCLKHIARAAAFLDGEVVIDWVD